MDKWDEFCNVKEDIGLDFDIMATNDILRKCGSKLRVRKLKQELNKQIDKEEE